MFLKYANTKIWYKFWFIARSLYLNCLLNTKKVILTVNFTVCSKTLIGSKCLFSAIKDKYKFYIYKSHHQ